MGQLRLVAGGTEPAQGPRPSPSFPLGMPVWSSLPGMLDNTYACFGAECHPAQAHRSGHSRVELVDGQGP